MQRNKKEHPWADQQTAEGIRGGARRQLKQLEECEEVSKPGRKGSRVGEQCYGANQGERYPGGKRELQGHRQ